MVIELSHEFMIRQKEFLITTQQLLVAARIALDCDIYDWSRLVTTINVQINNIKIKIINIGLLCDKTSKNKGIFNLDSSKK